MKLALLFIALIQFQPQGGEVTKAEIQKVIDRAHLEKFGEERDARRTRILEERAKNKAEDGPADEVDWEVYDSPARDRKQ